MPNTLRLKNDSQYCDLTLRFTYSNSTTQTEPTVKDTEDYRSRNPEVIDKVELKTDTDTWEEITRECSETEDNYQTFTIKFYDDRVVRACLVYDGDHIIAVEMSDVQ
jgi:hypothetical protein